MNSATRLPACQRQHLQAAGPDRPTCAPPSPRVTSSEFKLRRHFKDLAAEAAVGRTDQGG